MPVEFRLPDIGEGISEATLLAWHVDVGDAIAEGQSVAEISTDKVDVELPSPADGQVVARRVEIGETVSVGSVLLVIERAGEPAGVDVAQVAPAGPPAPPVSRRGAGRVIASPFARRYAAAHGIDVERLSGTGPRGRIVQADVQAAMAAEGFDGDGAGVPQSDHRTPVAAATDARGVRREPLDRVRAVMAERMARSARTLATSTTTFEVDASRMQSLVEQLRPDAQGLGLKLGPFAVVAFCTVAALRRHARFNATIDEQAQELLLHERVHLGVATATERGLVVPVVPAADGHSLLGLATALAGLVGRARDGRLDPADVRGATFALSSTGALERATIVSTQPIVNAPQTATMWCSRIVRRPWVEETGALVAAPVLTCSLSFDHRFIDGAEATAFINDLAAFLQRPERALAGAA